MDSPGLLFHPGFEGAAAREAEALNPATAWAAATPLPGGRGTVRRLTLAGRDYFVKREARGGLAGRVLPDRYLRREPFLREWALSRWLDEQGMTPPMWTRWFVPRGPAFEVFTLLEPLPGAHSMADAVRGGLCSAAELRAAGHCVGRLHALGVVHGDLNAGNLLLSPTGTRAIDWRHSARGERLPEPLRRENLDRLARSLVKVAGGDHPLVVEAWRALAEGYGEGFGATDSWLQRWAEDAGHIHPLRRWLWRRFA